MFTVQYKPFTNLRRVVIRVRPLTKSTTSFDLKSDRHTLSCLPQVLLVFYTADNMLTDNFESFC